MFCLVTGPEELEVPGACSRPVFKGDMSIIYFSQVSEITKTGLIFRAGFTSPWVQLRTIKKSGTLMEPCQLRPYLT